MTQGISVLIPAHNEEETLGETLDGIMDQNYEPFEVIVLDDASEDLTPQIAEEKGAKLIQNEDNKGKAFTINRGVKAAEYDIVCSLHADCVPEGSDWLDRMMECYDDETAAVSCGTVLQEEKVRKFNIFQKMLGLGVPESEYKRPKGCTETSLFAMKGDLYRKEEIEKIGYFGSDDFYQAGEDGDFALRLREQGKKIRRAPTFIYHNHGSHQQSFSDFLRKKVQYSEARGVNKRKHFSEMDLGVWNEATKSLLYLALLIPFVNLAAIAAILVKTLYQAYDYHQTYGDISESLQVIPLAVISDICNIAGFWKGFITGKQTI